MTARQEHAHKAVAADGIIGQAVSKAPEPVIHRAKDHPRHCPGLVKPGLGHDRTEVNVHGAVVHLVQSRPQNPSQVVFDVAAVEDRVDRQPLLSLAREDLPEVQVAVDREIGVGPADLLGAGAGDSQRRMRERSVETVPFLFELVHPGGDDLVGRRHA